MKTTLKNKSRPSYIGLLIALVILIIGASAVMFLASNQGHGQSVTTSEPAIPRGAPMQSWDENGHDGKYLLRIIEGDPPMSATAVSGVVETDTDCKADAYGLSHCHNEIGLADGTHITVIDTHLMSRYRCLKPGESVSLTRINSTWVVATLT